ncbi:MAG: aldolase/citrate lyase family protein [Bacteroidales bacterium]|jgi:citrate lyase subunit beta/citryl-CoA lyase|nr:aldolase/citrate lyase family protein [Bacteroidales bacterium]
MAARRKRRTMLYIPGNNPAMLQQGGVYGADGLLLDLEDAVALNQKDAARILVRNMINTVDFYNCEVTVRINHLDTPFGIADLEEIVPLQPDAIRYPKTESVEDLKRLISIVEEIEKKHNIENPTMTIHAMIETALGVQNVFDIAAYSKRVDCITIGGQDLTADMNVVKTKEGNELDFARKRIVMAAKANKIDAIDTVFADVDDDEGLKVETEMIKGIGFAGKAVINPRQISTIHDVFNPTEEEIRKAVRIIREFNKNREAGIGVFAIDGKMIDAPVVARAQYIIDVAGIEI